MRILFLLLLLALPLTACDEAENKTADQISEETTEQPDTALPPGLLVDGRPIDPFCFAIAYSLESKLNDIPVKDCKDDALVRGAEIVHGPYSEGISFQYAGEEFSMAEPYIQYEYIGRDPAVSGAEATSTPALDAELPIILRANTGGTGEFSQILWVKREGDILKKTRSVTGGDRCNGGLIKAAVNEEGQLTYEVNITPYDLIALGNPNAKVEAYDDIYACATCCVGTAEYEGSRLIRVILDGQQGTPSPDKPKQDCFDKLLNKKIDKNILEFSASDLTAFITQVEKSCF